MKYLKYIVLIVGFIVMSDSVFSKDWVVKVTQTGGRNSGCGVKFKHTSHYTGNYKETINCTGKGDLDCPTPTHEGGGSIAVVQDHVMAGNVSGIIYDIANLTITEFGNGKINNDGGIDFEAIITIFETEGEYNEYLEREN